MKDNIVQKKSFDFALKIIQLYKQLILQKKEFVLAKQILRCGTSIGANIEEAIGGQSRKDFFMKITIAYKEVRETHYWLRLLMQSGLISDLSGQQLLFDCDELLRIIGAIQKTTKFNS